MRGSARHPARTRSPSLLPSLALSPRPVSRRSWNIFLSSFFSFFPLFLVLKKNHFDAKGTRLIRSIGENVSGLQRAKTGTDKTLVKEVVQVTVLFSWVGGRARSPSGGVRGLGSTPASVT